MAACYQNCYHVVNDGYIIYALKLISIGGATVRTVVDFDEDSLSEARAALGTTTKVETVNRALVEVAALAARRRDLTRLVSGEYSVLADEELYRSAWR
jgi:hypothetical protein